MLSFGSNMVRSGSNSGSGIRVGLRSQLKPHQQQQRKVLFSRRLHGAAEHPLKAGFASTGLVSLVGLGAALIGGYYLFDARSAFHEYIATPVCRLVTDAETSHKIAVKLMKFGAFPRLYEDIDDPILEMDVFGKKLSNPIGIAAGLDKDAEAIDGLFSIGFGYVEVGSVTPEPQAGNPSPRVFRLPKDKAVINRYGFNSIGHFAVMTNLRLRLEKWIQKNNTEPTSNALLKNKILAVNLGKNKTGDEVNDYVLGVQRLGPLADVLVINVSSPNTPGLRSLQQESKLTNLLTTVVAERDGLTGTKPPVLVKIAPDLTEPEIESIANAVKKSKIDGVIVSNTTISRPVETMRTPRIGVINEVGGLSGPPVKPLALKAIRTLRKYTKDSDIVLVGCGGISNGKDAIEFAKAGASFVQLYTAFAYHGPALGAKIKEQVTAELKKEGKTWKEIIGTEKL